MKIMAGILKYASILMVDLLIASGANARAEDASGQNRAVDQVQLIHDQTLRMIAQGMDDREAAENVYIPNQLREGWENYGQVESHVLQVFNGTIGWFGGDVYDINPLSLHEETTRFVKMMGGVSAVRKAAADAANEGGFANWRWSLKLTSLLLRLDPADATARSARATAARAIGQRTTSANARGFYITEALQLEGELLVEGQPMTLDIIREFVGTPNVEQLAVASIDQNLQFVRYLVDPREGNDALVELNGSLDRSHLMRTDVHPPAVIEPKGKEKYSGGLEH